MLQFMVGLTYLSSAQQRKMGHKDEVNNSFETKRHHQNTSKRKCIYTHNHQIYTKLKTNGQDISCDLYNILYI